MFAGRRLLAAARKHQTLISIPNSNRRDFGVASKKRLPLKKTPGVFWELGKQVVSISLTYDFTESSSDVRSTDGDLQQPATYIQAEVVSRKVRLKRNK